MRFALLFRDVAERETRTATVLAPLALTDGLHLPVDEYGFDEMYCEERGCDCRRVMINVLARHTQQHVATINHAFEKPASDALVPEQTFLDPLNRQSPWAPAILELFLNVVLADKDYVQRLHRHYRMFKNVVNDPSHPAHRLLRVPDAAAAAEEGASRGRSITPPPPRSGKRKRWR